MKKLIGLIFGLMFVFSVASVSAVPMQPMPISGQIYAAESQIIDNLEIRAVNLNTMDELTTVTTSGQFMLELSDAPRGYRWGEVVKITVVFCEEEDFCNQEVILGDAPIHVEFDISQACLSCVVCEDWTQEQCNAKYPCTVTTTTTVPETTTTTLIPVPTEEECEELYPCPIVTNTVQIIITAILSIIATIGAGEGVKFVVRKRKSGEIESEATEHKHKDKYDYYHDINTKHENKAYRHPVNKSEVLDLTLKMGKEFPSDWKKWIYLPKYNMNGGEFPR